LFAFKLIYKCHWIVELASVIDGTHILLFEKPYLKVMLYSIGFCNYKKIHNTVLQGVCDCNYYFWIFYTSQFGGVVDDNGSFKLNTLYKKLKSWEILTKYILDIIGMQLYPYLLTKATYPIWTYLMKKIKDKCDWYLVWFDNSMNHGYMFIEFFLEFEKLVVCILKNINCKVDKGRKIIMAC